MSQPVAPPDSLDTLPFAVLIDEAWRSTRRHARAILVPLAIALAPAALLLQVISALLNLQMLGDAGNLDFTRFCGTFAIAIAAMLVVGLYFLGVYGTMMVTATQVAAGEPPAIRQALRFYLRPRVWATDLLAWLVTGLGFVACILPGLLLLAAWSLRLPVMAREGLYGWASLQRSWELLAHNPSRQLLRHPLLKVLALFVLGIVLAYAVSLVVQLPALVASQVMIFRQMSGGETADPQAALRATFWLTIPAGVIGALAQLAVQLYVDLATAHLYLDQRRRKEGLDIASALDRLLGPTAGPPTPASDDALAGGAGPAGIPPPPS
jgi:uncharacterized membrane protein